MQWPAHSHRPNETYIYLQIEESSITGRFEAPVTDLGRVFELDSNDDNEISEDEIATNIERIQTELKQSLSFMIAGKNASIRFTHRDTRSGDIGSYALLNFVVEYTGSIPDEITARYSGMMPKKIPDYKVLLLLESNVKTGLEENEAMVSLYFGEENSEQTVNLKGASGFEAFVLSIKHGFHHILIGFDHVALLIALLLPSVLIARSGRWVPVVSFQDGLINILKIVTVFTIAQSITLSLAALDIVRLPGQPIAIMIALSIVATAIINLTVVGKNWILSVMFGLGLLHGLGFTSVLLPLGVAKSTLLQSLLGFNIGIELGQVLIVAIIFPVLLLLSRWKHYVRVVLHGGSVCLILGAVYWFAERALGLVGRLLA